MPQSSTACVRSLKPGNFMSLELASMSESAVAVAVTAAFRLDLRDQSAAPRLSHRAVSFAMRKALVSSLHSSLTLSMSWQMAVMSSMERPSGFE